MKHPGKSFARTVLCLVTLLILASCASDDNFERRLKERNDKYYDYNQRRKMRLQARQERTDMWFDRMMHH